MSEEAGLIKHEYCKDCGCIPVEKKTGVILTSFPPQTQYGMYCYKCNKWIRTYSKGHDFYSPQDPAKALWEKINGPNGIYKSKTNEQKNSDNGSKGN